MFSQHSWTTDSTVTLNVNGKAIPLQAWKGPWGSRKLKIPECVDNWHMKVVRLSTLRTGRLYPQEMSPLLISVTG